MDLSFPSELWRLIAVPITGLEQGIRRGLEMVCARANASAGALDFRSADAPELRTVFRWPTEPGAPDELAGDRDLVSVEVQLGPSHAGRLRLRLRDAERLGEPEMSVLQVAAELLLAAILRRTSEGALRESEARFRALAEHATELVAELDPEGRYLYASPSFKELLGRDPASLIGVAARDLVHPDDLPGARESLAEALEAGSIAHSVHRLRHADGSWRWFDNTGRSYSHSEDQLHFVSIGRDVTESINTARELRESQAQLIQAQKLEAVGRLAGGIAHDFNNLLTVVSGNAEILQMRLERAGLDVEEVKEILLATDRASALTRQLMTFSRPHLAQRSEVDLREVVRGVEPMLRRLIGVEVVIEFEAEGELGLVVADPNQLEQVVLNLALNAGDAMPGGGTLRIETTRRFVGAGEARRLGLDSEGTFVVLSVRDEGSGMDPETIARIFEPFFTTKELGSGTGLGLSIVYRVVKQAGGAVDVESWPGRGSAFHVFLPWLGSPREEGEARRWSPARGGSETVLVVDDEPGSGRLICAMLEEAGYRTLQASASSDALAMSRSHDAAIDLLISDVVMPGMRGPELAKQLLVHRPQLRIIFASGHPDELDRTRDEFPMQPSYLRKPFRRHELLSSVRATLDRPRP